MTPEEEQQFHQQQAQEGSREAAAWALRLLEDGFVGPAGDLFEYLEEINAEKRTVILSQLVRLTAEFGIKARDMDDVRQLLRFARRG